jgi:integrase/recombinase XerD
VDHLHIKHEQMSDGSLDCRGRFDGDEAPTAPVVAFPRESPTAGRSVCTLRSDGMAQLRWWRFLLAVDVSWNRTMAPRHRRGCSTQAD